MPVVLDTNALMTPFQARLNLDMEIERLLGKTDIYVPSCVLGELKRLAARRWEAKAALQLAGKYRIVEVDSLGDAGVIEAAKKLNAYVFTNDRILISSLRKEGLGVITLSNNHLVILDE